MKTEGEKESHRFVVFVVMLSKLLLGKDVMRLTKAAVPIVKFQSSLGG